MSVEDDVKALSARVISLEVYFKVALGVAAVFGVSGALVYKQLSNAREQITALETTVNDMQPVVDASIKKIRDEAQSEASKLATTAEAYLQQKLDQRFRALGQTREGKGHDVTNNNMGALKANCEPGTFVSAVIASGAVGGKYATDGISRLTVVCTPVQPGA